jgi:hypothetical protein
MHLLMQEVIHHQEQLYKVYLVGTEWDYLIKKSIPDSLIFADDYFFFKTKDKFKEEAFTKFTKTSRLNEKLLDLFAIELSKFLGLTLFGMDILIDENEENIYLVDINYFSSYEGLQNMNVPKAFRKLIKEQYEQFRQINGLY